MTKKYQPSNATEGFGFQAQWCGNCVNQQHSECEIKNKTMWYSIDDEEYPVEWQYNERNQPICTKFKQRKGNNND